MGTLLSIVLATENKHKQLEFQSALGGKFKLFTLNDIGFRHPLPLESGTTYEENAAIKAQFVGGHLDMPVLSDDSGFEVEALGGQPGVHSARFLNGAASSLQCQEILKRMGPEKNRRARFVCVLSLYSPRDKKLQLFRGECHGVVATTLRGEKGFGYDPIFVPDQSTKTFAELNVDEKWAISHRGQAFNALREFFNER